MLDTRLLSALQKLNSALYQSVGSDLKKYNLNASEFRILLYLKQSGRSKTQTIGEAAPITSGAITYFANKFQKKGYVERSRDEIDKRVYWLELTKSGHLFLEDVLEKHTKHVNKVLSIFNDEEKEKLYNEIRYFTKELKKEERRK